MAGRKFPPSFWDSSYQRRSSSSHHCSEVFAHSSYPFQFSSAPFPLYDLLRPKFRLDNVYSFPLPNSSLFSKLNFLRSHSSKQNRFHPTLNGFLHSPHTLSTSWKTYAELSSSFLEQKLNAYRSFAVAKSSSFSNIFKPSNFLSDQSALAPSSCNQQNLALSPYYADNFHASRWPAIASLSGNFQIIYKFAFVLPLFYTVFCFLKD